VCWLDHHDIIDSPKVFQYNYPHQYSMNIPSSLYFHSIPSVSRYIYS
jgi:hypothetical protein